MNFLTLKDMDLEGKKVLVRVDYNVPIKNGIVEEDTRLKATIPTINFLLEKKCKIILISHLGRPQKLLKKGVSLEEVKKELTLKPVAEELTEILGVDVEFVDDCIDIEIPKDKDIILLENLRFHKEEEENNENFAKKLAENSEVYVNDAFGVSHREQASVFAITKFQPSCAGLLVQKEVEQLSKLLDPEKPFIALVAGAKKDKINILNVLAKKVDKILLGGALANTFLKAKGIEIGSSKFDKGTLESTKETIKLAGKKIILPEDAVVADNCNNGANVKTVGIKNIPEKWIILDIGPKTIETYKENLKDAKTVLWAGPLGAFEMNKFSKGTKEIGEFLGSIDAKKVAGGGDTLAAIDSFDLSENLSYISTGGGASLEFIGNEGRLPALIQLEKYYNKIKEE